MENEIVIQKRINYAVASSLEYGRVRTVKFMGKRVLKSFPFANEVMSQFSNPQTIRSSFPVASVVLSFQPKL